MASLFTATALRIRPNTRPLSNVVTSQCRLQSTATTPTIISTAGRKEGAINDVAKPKPFTGRPLAHLSTSSILRTLLLSAFFTSPSLFRAGFPLFQTVADSQSVWLNPDRNPVLRMVIFPLVYKQFCAGRNQAEISTTSSEVRRLGFSGVVLCYGREVQVHGDKFVGYDESHATTMENEIDEWTNGNIETLNMTIEGDWLGMK